MPPCQTGESHWARKLAENSYPVTVEAPRVGGRVDVLAVRGDGGNPERIGIEVETGKSYYVQNVKNCLRSGFSRVVVAANRQERLTED